MNRRHAIFQCSTLAIGMFMSSSSQSTSPSGSTATRSSTFTPLVKSKADWKTLLSPQSYAVLFEEATERAGTSPLNEEKRKGTFLCAACNLPLFTKEQKFDSGTGWPSFFDVLPGAVGQKRDFKMILPRTEYHCARCGGHQGHVFNDGPRPTGLRYCNNGVALQFVVDGEKLPELRT
jgi:peptide-methionine (R)-S-oxide reductase